jgi:hypothetical protein
MIPEIGLMVGLYIVTRMTQLMLTVSAQGTGVERTTKLLALLTIVLTGLFMVDLLMRGTVGFSLKEIPELTK